MDLSKLDFTSTLNYLKRDPNFVGSDTITLGGAGVVAYKYVYHNFGYVPFVTVGADLLNDGMIFCQDAADTYTETSLSSHTHSYPTLLWWVNTSTLTIGLRNNAGASGDRTVYWAIYKDYDS